MHRMGMGVVNIAVTVELVCCYEMQIVMLFAVSTVKMLPDAITLMTQKGASACASVQHLAC